MTSSSLSFDPKNKLPVSCPSIASSAFNNSFLFSHSTINAKEPNTSSCNCGFATNSVADTFAKLG
jgi:hypothetical protein